MKKRTLLNLLVMAVFSQLFFACNAARQYEFTNSTEAYHSGKAVAKTSPAVNIEITKTSEATTIQNEVITENLTANNAETAAPLPAEPVVKIQPEEKKVKEIQVNSTVVQNVKITKTQKQELKTVLKKLKKQQLTNNDTKNVKDVDVLELILAILLPPIGVFLHDDGLSTKFWISLILTLLFFIPGMIFAILVVTDVI